MQVVFLGTASCFPTANRGVSCIALRHEDGFVWLFDCGEGSQIQLQKSCIRPGKITKIFITHLHGDHLFGLPGLVATISTQCAVKPDFILEIYGPQGLRQFLRQSLVLSRTELPFKYQVHELMPESYQLPEDWENWRFDLSEERLHPQELQGTQISARNDVWTVIEQKNTKTSVLAGHNEHLRIPSYGFVVQEPDANGKLDVEKLKSLGVEPGPLYSQLKHGKDIVTPDGKVVKSNEVLGPPKKGRKITIMGDTCNSDKMIQIAMDSDALVHEATLENSMVENALEKGHSTPGMAASYAFAINAKLLLLTHFSQRYRQSNEEDGPRLEILQREAEEKLAELKHSKCSVVLAQDLLEVPLYRLST
ncbi:zinc phosphodiesterase ELAC protein 1-like [Neocloeon triangulifer]|uniref:zinc phosphodiesterase ELAC protein 1-like n=1 Tax=Neocloeon triangulifer TaxID=2078957 RepID=UPI00286F0DF4|nr:zinc phosphodiesterase ELAC protein 1-like [Neocloeon triangulifer]